MATHSSVLAWRIPGTGELGGLPSMGSHRVGHDWSNLAEAAVTMTYMRDAKRDTNVKNSLLDSVGEGKGGIIWENSIKTYIIICVTDHQSRFDAWDRVLSVGALEWPWVMWWGGRWEGGSGWGTHVHPWLIHVNVWQKPLQYCKVINLQLK